MPPWQVVSTRQPLFKPLLFFAAEFDALPVNAFEQGACLRSWACAAGTDH